MRIGIDWGGTKIEAIALGDAGETLARERVATPGNYDDAVRAVVALIGGIEGRLSQRGSIGVGIPGTISPATGFVKNANSVWLNGRALDRDLAGAFAREVRIENDANCLAVSEAVDGAGAGAAVVWAIIIGTGVGSGIAINGRPLSGRERIGGEWGHNPLPRPSNDERPGPRCWCGRDGCIETWLSGPAFAADHGRVTGRTMLAQEIMTAARAGDAQSSATLSRYIDRLGRAIGHVINILDPDVIVLGGGLSNVDEILSGAKPATAPHVFSDRFSAPLLRARHGDSSGVRGAAWLWPKD